MWRQTCPRCGSYDYIESIYTESCDDCGYSCDYRGSTHTTSQFITDNESNSYSDEYDQDDSWKLVP
jgi:predicted nucleic-acid-binding Zn-ribbon protein